LTFCDYLALISVSAASADEALPLCLLTRLEQTDGLFVERQFLGGFALGIADYGFHDWFLLVFG
jgi:hypothetical protein